jgi:hypothetical protein
MDQPKVRFIADILEEHFEEIQALWIRREAALQSPEHTLRTLARLDERIEAHVSAMLPRGDVVPALVSEALTGSFSADAFAAAYVLLRLGDDEQARRVLEAFLTSEGGTREGIRNALCQAPIGPLASSLTDALAKSPPALAVAAAEVLAFHGQLDRNSEELTALLEDDDPAVRRDAWRVVSIVDTAPRKRA